MDFPERFVRTQVEMYGPAGQTWVDQIPQLLGEYSEKWGLTLGRPFSNLSFNLVLPARTREGADVVLKAGFPSAGRESEGEVAALRHFDGQGAIRLLQEETERGVFLIERAMPGEMLTTVKDDREATIAAAKLTGRIHRAPPESNSFTKLSSWVDGFGRLRTRFGGTTGPLPGEMVERAERLGSDLLTSTDRTVLLHGDLHHANILSSDRAPWLAIDPKGVVGDAAYEPAPFLANPRLETEEILRTRVDVFASELEIPKGRILDWAFVYGMMSAWWTIEDGGSGWEGPVAFARRLLELRQG